jgi:hypothetical protein
LCANCIRKPDHVLLWILGCDSAVSVQSKENFNEYQGFAFTLLP